MHREFILELATLLEKHNASIDLDFADGSDTMGMLGEHMTVSFADNSETVLSIGYSVEAEDLFKALSMSPAQWKHHCDKLVS